MFFRLQFWKRFLDGCETLLGCTLLQKGNLSPLTKTKNCDVIQFCQENHFLLQSFKDSHLNLIYIYSLFLHSIEKETVYQVIIYWN